MKVTITYTTLVSIKNGIGVAVKYKPGSKTIKGIVMTKRHQEEPGSRYEKKFNIGYTLLMNLLVLTKQHKLGEKLVNAMQIKAERELGKSQ